MPCYGEQKLVAWYPTKAQSVLCCECTLSKNAKSPSVVSVLDTLVITYRVLNTPCRRPLWLLGHDNGTGGVGCSRGEPGQCGVLSGAAMRPVRADAHAPTSTESSPNFPQAFGVRGNLPNPNFRRSGPSLVGTKIYCLFLTFAYFVLVV